MRINNFNFFLLKEALLESVMHSSTDLRNLLSNIRYKESGKVAEIAQTILDFIQQQKDIKTNYNGLDLSPTKNDDIGFVPDNQFQKALSDDKNPWDKEKTYTRIGRMVRQLLKDNNQTFLDKDIEQFVNAYKSQWDRKHGLHKKVSIVSGKDIQFWYSNKNYYDVDKGTLGSSCMSSASDNHYMQIYAGNPDKISLVILTEDDKLTARALLWKLDSDSNGHELYLDRIYTMQDSDRRLVKDWVLENVVKNNTSIFTDYHDDDNLGEVIIDLNTEFSHYPYADTMSYLYKEINDHKLTGKGFLSNRKDLDVDKHISFTMFSTGGGIDCYSGHKYVHIIDSWYPSSECLRVMSSNLGLYNDWYPKDLCKYSKSSSKWCPKEDLVYSEAMGDWILEEESIEDDDFGLVLDGYVIEAIIEYEGDKNAFEIYQLLIDNNLSEFKTVKAIRNSTCFRVSIGSYEYYFDNSLKVDGGLPISYPSFLTMNVFKTIDKIGTDILKRLPIYYKEYAEYYITKEDADYYNIKIDDQSSVVVNVDATQNSMFYKEYLKGGVEVNKEYDASYKEYITFAHEFMKEYSRSYNNTYALSEILSKVKHIENYIVDSAIEGYKNWISGNNLKDSQFRSYFDDNGFGLLESDIDAMLKLRDLSAIFAVAKDGEHLKSLVAASVSEYLEYMEDFTDEGQLDRLSYACGVFASRILKTSCINYTVEAFKKRVDKYTDDHTNYINLISTACKTLDKEKLYLRIQKELGKIF